METCTLNTDINILTIAAKSFPEGIQKAFDDLRHVVEKSNDRIYFGISKPQYGKIIYHAGVEEQYENEGYRYGLERFIISKGIYLMEKIFDYKDNIGNIGLAFNKLLQDPQLDPASSCIEWYKGESEMWCMVKLLTKI